MELIIEGNQEDLWNNVVFIRSSPGAGKTSLLRLFEPNSLNTIYNHKSQQDYRELYNTVCKLDVINETGVSALGVLIQFTKNYEILDDIKYSEVTRIRLFYSLLNARLVLATLRSICELNKLSYPNDLEQINYEYENEKLFLRNIQSPCDGRELFNWASGLEKSVYDILDSFIQPDVDKIEGHDELFTLEILQPKYFKVNGRSSFRRIIYMLDDAHKLSKSQRSSLFKYVIDQRGNFNIWISERLEGITEFKSYHERDYYEVNLEKYWGNNTSKFKKMLSKIASKRAAISTDDVDTFAENLDDSIDEQIFQKEIKESIETTRKKIQEVVRKTKKFQDWLDYLIQQSDTSLKTAILHKSAEILIHRNLRKSQMVLQFALSIPELIDKIDPSIESAARYFLSNEYGIPNYYGFQKLVVLSSNNIEQFLAFASDLFEGMLSNKIASQDVQLSTKRQEKIIALVVKKKWNDLSTILPNPKAVEGFLNKLGNYFNKITYEPTASYAPGITGFAVHSSRRLIEEKGWQENEIFEELQDTISTCLAYNLLEVKEVSQGAKNQIWTVYYLNRWLCVKYQLPFTYGGWNKLTPEELLKWTK
ncbi:MAG: hypothetical protein IIA45_05875 [Bacteroidetes bacterium]|nr:hypothetical protein [Bacteroidota bacterium]